MSPFILNKAGMYRNFSAALLHINCVHSLRQRLLVLAHGDNT
jgi:hypothetical protein